MKLHPDIGDRARRAALILAATALALAGVLVSMHVAVAHHGHAHPGDQSDCVVCLHWHHHAVMGTEVWWPAVCEMAAVLTPLPSPRPGSMSVPTACGRAPPALV